MKKSYELYTSRAALSFFLNKCIDSQARSRSSLFPSAHFPMRADLLPAGEFLSGHLLPSFPRSFYSTYDQREGLLEFVGFRTFPRLFALCCCCHCCALLNLRLLSLKTHCNLCLLSDSWYYLNRKKNDVH